MSERGRGRCAPGLESPWLPPAAARSGAHWAGLAVARHQPEAAARLLGASHRLRDELSAPVWGPGGPDSHDQRHRRRHRGTRLASPPLEGCISHARGGCRACSLPHRLTRVARAQGGRPPRLDRALLEPQGEVRWPQKSTSNWKATANDNRREFDLPTTQPGSPPEAPRCCDVVRASTPCAGGTDSVRRSRKLERVEEAMRHSKLNSAMPDVRPLMRSWKCASVISADQLPFYGLGARGHSAPRRRRNPPRPTGLDNSRPRA